VALPLSVVRGGSALAGALLFALVFFVSVASAASSCADAKLSPTKTNGEALQAAVLCLINQERRDRGLTELKAQPQLLKAAKRHSDDMVRRHYFDHTSPTGNTMKDRAVAAKYIRPHGSWRVAENIAWGGGSLGSPAKIVAGWMKSPPHRANILDPGLRHAGIGTAGSAPSGRAGATFTVVLGVRS
jgi:uncharacterized protein YkwD